MADRSRDLWDIIRKLVVAQTAPTVVDSPGQFVDDYQALAPETILMSTGSVTIKNDGHSGVYLWNDTTSIWGLAQWG